MADPPPLVLCMDNINGDEVTLKIDPHDDFRLFFDKAKSQLGFDIDLNSITGNQPVSLDDNIYQFFLNNQQNVTRHISDSYIQPGYSDIEKENDDLVYVLDDGTQINATQIQFDNEDPLIDLTAEKIPFVKYTDDPVEENDINDNISIKDFHIDSPVSRWSSRNSSPTRAKSFINSLPFKSICNNTLYEMQFRKYLESNTKTYAVLNPVNRAASPTTIIKDNYNKYEDLPIQKDVFTREDILNMFKDSPVTHLPYDKSINYDKRKHSRKSDPSRIVHKSWYKTNLDSGPNQDCCICGKIIRNNYEKMYLFDNEDQRIHRCSPQKRTSVQLKIICEQCLEDHFKLCLVKSPNESLNSDEYLVIKNNQQYIFQNITDIDLKRKFSDQNKEKPRPEKFNGTKESSSDVEIIEPETEIDKAIDNVDEADEEVKEFLGKYQTKHLSELKCRFCDNIFVDLQEVMDHCEEHKHDLDEEAVFPCPLCDYGYANLKWLKGHVKTAHDPPKESRDAENKDNDINDTSKTSSPVATRTRSAAKKSEDVGKDDEIDENKSVEGNTAPMQLETVVKQETLDSDDEDIWIVHTGDDVDEQLQSLLKFSDVKTEKSQLSQKVNELIKHKCFNCSRIFPNAETLNTHKCRKRGRKRKSPTDPVLCVPSKEDFFKRAQGRPKQTHDDSLLKIRKKRSRSGSPQIVTCHNCNESFSSKVRLKFHMQFHEKSALQTEDGQYKCNECVDTTFLTETELFDHIHFQHSKQKKWQCPVKDCGKTFFLRATLTKHSRTHTDTRRYVCVTCGKRFLDKQTLDEHGVTHLQIKPFQCHICLKQLTRRSRLRMHLRAHEEELCPKLVLVCGICSRAFRDHTDAQDHLTKSECIETFANELKQDEPSERLSPTSGLVTQAAKTESTLSKPLPREVSQEESQPLLEELDDAAKAIVRVVRIEKAFRCEYCEDVFYLEGALNSHRIHHKGVKNPFVCHVCKVSFATYSRCTTHKTTHGFYKRNLTDGKKEESASSAGILGYGGFPVVKHFLCEDCGRSYLHWTYLQVHRRLKHANENFLFKCNQCELTFPNSWSVAYHRKKIHGKTAQEDGGTTKIARQDYYRIPCRDCDQVLPNKFELYKHRQKEHCDEALDDYEEMIKDSTICPKCGHNLHNVNALQKHLKEVHGIQNDVRSVSARNEPMRSLNVLRRPPMRRTFNCPRCPGRFRQVIELQAHIRLKHPSFTIVIELENSSLTREDVLKQLSLHNIPRESVSEAYYISVPLGIPHIIPNSPQALEMLSNSFPRTDVILVKPNEGLAN